MLNPGALTDSDPLVPPGETGLNRTPMVQDEPFEASVKVAVVGQVPGVVVERAKAPLTETAMPVTGTSGMEVLATVTNCAALLVPTAWLPNVSAAGETTSCVEIPGPFNAT